MKSFKEKKFQAESLKLSKNVVGKLLSNVFVLARKQGLKLRVSSIDGEKVQPRGTETSVLVVEVVHSLVKKSWIE